mmetsp:Transcript_94795/g.178368  ORF Transcript_94795/g.178368 Transcript_94795/m.178368 type:complete len:118 (+) Transcript_94795:60-413(+)
MGQSLCQRRAAPGIAPQEHTRRRSSSPVPTPSRWTSPFPSKDGTAQATAEDKAVAISLCEKCILAYSRVAMETIHSAGTVAELHEYVKDLQARERMLGGYTGKEDRRKEGTDAACYF